MLRLRTVRASTVAVIIGLQAMTSAQTPGAPAPARHVDRPRLIRDMRALASPTFEGRRTGTPGGRRAREWLVGEFRAAGLTPAGTTDFVQEFDIAAGDAAAPSEGPGANVLGRVESTGRSRKTLVVTAHYDHLGVRNGVLYPGADDNASGVAVLLAAARHFVRNRPRHTMLFAALDAEERGLQGARALVGSALLPVRDVALAVNLDMVSRNSRNEIFAAGPSYTPWLAPVLRDVQTRATVVIRLGHDRPAAGAAGLEDWTRSSDHAPFHEQSIPFVYFGVEDHGDYHTPRDTTARVDARFFGDAADMIIEALRGFDRAVE